ncbi:MAG TPA: RcnB family protein [Allosphingosinicella sp.]|jgi:Ni/Co efflux regulator RcnB|nr:RcnB family protein [Allosphingosinicella sp.]
MRLLALVALTATAAWVAPAAAQTVPDPDPYYGVSPDPNMPPPPPRRRMAPPAGTTWQAPQGDMHMRMQGPPPQGMGQQQTFVVRRMGPGDNMDRERRNVEYRRIDRGGVVPQRWWGPDVQVRSWQTYGFPQPFQGGRWIRYYDDALLIDGDGRVHDSRQGWDWDRYGERWGADGDGVPVYVGNGDFQPRGRDYEWAEHYDRREMDARQRVQQRVYVQHAPMAPMGPPPAPPGYGGGYGYGAPYMGYGPVLVTETTVTEAPVVEQRTIVTYETVRVPVRHRHHVRRCTCRVMAPPPPPGGGERG